MHIRPASPDDAVAIETIRVRGWRSAYRHVFPAAELDALRSMRAVAVAPARAAARLDDGRVRGRGRVVGFASTGPEPRRGRARRALRDLRRPRDVVDRRRPGADGGGGAAARRGVRRGDSCGCSRTTRAPAASTSARAGRPTGSARRRSVSASALPRCATARTSRDRATRNARRRRPMARVHWFPRTPPMDATTRCERRLCGGARLFEDHGTRTLLAEPTATSSAG